MKKTLLLTLSFLIMGLAFASPNIQGDFSLNGNLNFDENFDTTITNDATINLFLLSKSNNVKYTIKNSTIIDSNESISNEIEQAYLLFRVPYKDNYLTFNFGKTPLDIGGDWIYNSGTPFTKNPWIASIKTKLYQREDFSSLNLEFIAKLPIQDDDKKIGARFTYDVNNKYFGTFETTFLTDKTESILCGGFNGTLFFDYGIYGKTDLQNINNFEMSLYLLKITSSSSFKFKMAYFNVINSLNILPTLSYNINSKATISFGLNTKITTNSYSLELTPLSIFSYNIVQGLDFQTQYSYSKDTNNNIKMSITHKF